MKKRKMQNIGREAEDNVMDGFEMKAGNLAHFFSQLDPNTSVYNPSEGRFAVAASDADIDHLAKVYCGDDHVCECNHDEYNCDCNDRIMYKYGDEPDDIKIYDTGNFHEDNLNMDTDFAMFMGANQHALANAIADVIAENTDNIISNIIDYQNTKNKRAAIEIARVVRK